MLNNHTPSFEKIRSRMVVLEASNIDTDQIIPARFLTTTQKNGLGVHLFHDWRYDAAGKPRPDFILNQEHARKSQILVAGDNFGCGSSREHAPWALHDYGFRVIISTKIADIFYNNALKNGLLPVEIDAGLHAWLIKNPTIEITVDLKSCTILLPGGKTVSFEVEPFARKCLLQGLDELEFIRCCEDRIAIYESIMV